MEKGETSFALGRGHGKCNIIWGGRVGVGGLGSIPKKAGPKVYGYVS